MAVVLKQLQDPVQHQLPGGACYFFDGMKEQPSKPCGKRKLLVFQKIKIEFLLSSQVLPNRLGPVVHLKFVIDIVGVYLDRTF